MQNEQPDYPQTPRETRALAWVEPCRFAPDTPKARPLPICWWVMVKTAMCVQRACLNPPAPRCLFPWQPSIIPCGYFAMRGYCRKSPWMGRSRILIPRLDPHLHYFWRRKHGYRHAPNGAVRFHTQASAPKGMEIARLDVIIRLRKKRGA